MKKNRFLLFCIGIIFFTSCQIFNPTRMLRTGVDYQYDTIANIKQDILYKLAINDVVTFSITTNDGEMIINPLSGLNGQNNSQNSIGTGSTIGTGSAGSAGSYLVEYDGTIKLPLIGRVYVKDKTIREMETYLETEYTRYFNKPFVKVDVVNKRVFLFRGSTANVTTLQYQNTTLFQLLAQAGGVGDAKAHRIKLIRNMPQKTFVYSIDLSRIENINQGNIVLQANDIIYITPRDKVASEILTAVAPYTSIFATLVAAYALFKK